MGINLFDFYSIGVLNLVLLGILIFFTFFVKEPKDEKKGVKQLLWTIRTFAYSLMFKIFILYLMLMLVIRIVSDAKDLPYIIRQQPETALVEVLTGTTENATGRARRILVRNIETGEIFELLPDIRPIYPNEIFYVEFLPHSGRASLIVESQRGS